MDIITPTVLNKNIDNKLQLMLILAMTYIKSS